MRSKSDKKKPLVPSLRFPEFREAGAWEKKRLGTQGGFLTPLSGKSAKDFDTGDAKFIPYMNVFSNTFTDIQDLRSVIITDDESQNAVAKGDVFFTVSSETPEEAGMSSVLLGDVDRCYLNSFCALFRFDDHLSPNLIFLGYLLRSRSVRCHLSRGAQGATRYNISKLVFKELPLVFPLAKEQQKIAHCLSSLDEVIGLQAKKVQALKQHKKGLMQQLFPAEGETTPRLRFPDFREAGAWEVKYGNSLFIQISNKEHNASLPVLAITQENGAIPRHLIDYHVSVTEKSLKSYKVVDIGDFIISLRTFQGGIEYSDYKGICSPAYIVLRAATEEVINDFFRHYFKTEKYIADLNRNLEGLRDGKMVSYKQFSEIKLPLPISPEQQKIAHCLSSLDEVIGLESHKLDALKNLKKGLMQQLFP
ncbi:restriction endonuclease subunit S, partial [Thiolapillus sp.]|uniref:restriction endonuclease subunit S n=1 Tax=Thiolapillus sp. TaxID=2017437 RepID=UPI003AF8BDD9